MSVDLGLARTGIALCDALQTLAFPKTVIHEHNTTRLVDKISQLAKEYGAKRIVVIFYPQVVLYYARELLF